MFEANHSAGFGSVLQIFCFARLPQALMLAPPSLAAMFPIEKKQPAFFCLAHLNFCQVIFTPHVGAPTADQRFGQK